jgi:hypothetical protein
MVTSLPPAGIARAMVIADSPMNAPISITRRAPMRRTMSSRKRSCTGFEAISSIVTLSDTTRLNVLVGGSSPLVRTMSS